MMAQKNRNDIACTSCDWQEPAVQASQTEELAAVGD